MHPPTGDLTHNPGMCPRLGMEPMTLWFAGSHSIHWATPARALSSLIIKFKENSLKLNRECIGSNKWNVQGKRFLQVWLGTRLPATKSGSCKSHLTLCWPRSLAAALSPIPPASTPMVRKHSFSSSPSKNLGLTLISWLTHISTRTTKLGLQVILLPFART